LVEGLVRSAREGPAGAGPGAAGVRFREIVETLPLVTYLDRLDAARTPIYVSPQIEALLGYTPEELLAGRPSYADLIHPDDRADPRPRPEGPGPHASEYRLVARDGRIVWVHDAYELEREAPSGEPRVQGYLLDITERREAELALERRDRILAAVADAAGRFLEADDWGAAIGEVLALLGEATDVSSVHLFANTTDREGVTRTSMLAEWTAEGVPPLIGHPDNQDVPFHSEGFEAWTAALEAGRGFATVASAMPPAAQAWMEEQGTRSFVDAPVFVEGSLWGWMSLNDRERERRWSAAEIEGVRVAANVLGSAIQREVSRRGREAAEEQYRRLVESLPVVVYVEDIAYLEDPDATQPRGYISPAIMDILGYSLEEWDEPYFAQRIAHPDDRHLLEGPYPAAPGPHHYEYRLIARDGRVVWFHDEYVVVLDEEGRPVAAQGTMVDVTERRQMEEELREANETLSALIASSPLAIVVLDLEDRVVLWNEAAERMYGWTAEEVLGNPLPTRPPEREHEGALFREVSERGERLPGVETYRLRKDGRRIEVSISLSPLHDAHGKLVGTLAIHADVTESRRAEQALREREQRFRAVFDATTDALAIVDDDRRCLEVNAAAAAIAGVTAEELAGRELDELLSPEAIERLDAVWAVFRASGAWDGEVRYERPDGAHRQLELALRADVLPGRHLVIARDVTQTKELQAQLLHSQRMEAIGRLAGGIAHDFNNILTAIQGYAGFLLDSLPADSRERADAEEISRAAERAASLVRQLLTFSRKQILRPARLDVNEVIRETETMLRRLIGEDVRLVTQLADALPPVSADQAHLEQTIVNLAVNARDAMPDGGTLTIRTAAVRLVGVHAQSLGLAEGECVLIEVSDTGVGMTEEIRERAFEPFFTTKDHGTGLGLSTVYGTVTQAGGQLAVRSEPGRGTTFTIYLPAASWPVTVDGGPGQPFAPPGGSESVLLVEDEDVVRELAARILEGAGYRVLQADSGDAALEFAGRPDERIDLVLTDVVMPGMNGRELAERLAPARPDARVLFMSGYADDTVLARGIPGGRELLAKPFTPETLLREVRRALDARRAPSLRSPGPDLEDS
jgi:PAS domain S-box-containing protein